MCTEVGINDLGERVSKPGQASPSANRGASERDSVTAALRGKKKDNNLIENYRLEPRIKWVCVQRERELGRDGGRAGRLGIPHPSRNHYINPKSVAISTSIHYWRRLSAPILLPYTVECAAPPWRNSNASRQVDRKISARCRSIWWPLLFIRIGLHFIQRQLFSSTVAATFDTWTLKWKYQAKPRDWVINTAHSSGVCQYSAGEGFQKTTILFIHYISAGDK